MQNGTLELIRRPAVLVSGPEIFVLCEQCIEIVEMERSCNALECLRILASSYRSTPTNSGSAGDG